MIYGDKDIREKVFAAGVVENAHAKQINPRFPEYQAGQHLPEAQALSDGSAWMGNGI